MDTINFIKRLCKVSPRLGVKEKEAAKIIKTELDLFGVPYKEQFFNTSVPICQKAELRADGEIIPCLGSSLLSGKIPDAKFLISGFGYTGKKTPYNINYNPTTDEISVVDFHPVPSLAVSRRSLMKLVMAKKIKGKVLVKKEKFWSENILAGNRENPEEIVFAHYDSVVGSGALDNAGAVAVMLETILSKKKLLKNNLFVFAGNEEISFDNYKLRSGYGFRVFEREYGKLLANCKRIIVIDGVGIDKPLYCQHNLQWVFQVKTLDGIKEKVFWLQNDQSKVSQVFHTKADVVGNLKESHLKAAVKALINRKACLLSK